MRIRSLQSDGLTGKLVNPTVENKSRMQEQKRTVRFSSRWNDFERSAARDLREYQKKDVSVCRAVKEQNSNSLLSTNRQ